MTHYDHLCLLADLSDARPGQKGSLLTISERIEIAAKNIAIVLPTRYGKSDVIRLIAFSLWRAGLIGASLALNSSGLLRNQIVDDKKVRAMQDRYNMRFPVKYLAIDAPLPRPNANGEALISATIQLVHRNIDIFAAWVRSEIARTGKPVIVFIDEAQSTSQKNEWGKSARMLSEAGAIIVLVTATPYRADNVAPYGFRVVELDTEEVKRYVSRPGSIPETVTIEEYVGTKRLYKLDADYSLSFKQAWGERPSPIAKLSWKPFAVQVKELRKDEYGDMLREVLSLCDLSPSVVRKILGRIVREPSVIRHGVGAMLHELAIRKAKDREIQAIVFCGNDENSDDPEIRQHTEAVRKEIAHQNPHLRVGVAISADGEGQATIETFKRGELDILIVKMMAGLGLDQEPLKVALDLSPVRTAAAFVQRIMRVATIYKRFHGVLICPDEPLGRGLFERFVQEEGGIATETEMELADSYEIPRKEKPEAPLYLVNGLDDADFGDSDQNWASKDLLSAVEAFQSLFPDSVGAETDARLAAKIQAIPGMAQVLRDYSGGNESAEAIDTGARIIDLRRRITDNVKQSANLILKMSGHSYSSDPADQQRYALVMKSQYGVLYSPADLRPFRSTTLALQNDLSILGRLLEQSERMLFDATVEARRREFAV